MGTYKKKKAEVIGAEHKGKLWNMGLIGDYNLQGLLDTLVYTLVYILPFMEESIACYSSSYHSSLVEPAGAHPFLIFAEFVLKTNQDELLHCKSNQYELFIMLISNHQITV